MEKGYLKSYIKFILYFFLFYSHFFDLLLKLLTKARKDHPCIILLYHRIIDDHSEYLNKGPVVHHHIKHFKKEIPYLRGNYKILGMDEVVHHMKMDIGFEKPSLAITFDDGYLDNYTFAYSVLKKHGVVATIYLTTGLIETSESTWTDRIELSFLKTKEDYFSLPAIFGDNKVRIKTKKEKEQANIKVSEALKLMSDGERRKLMRELFEVLKLDGSCVENQRSRLMLNWDEVQKMAKDGIIIGSHSHTHPILSQMPLQDAKEEIFNSKKIIEENLGMRVKHFAFPNGREEDFSEELREYCREIGFESVASVVYGMNDTGENNTLSLKRIGAIAPVWMLAGDILLRLVKYYLAKP